MDDPASAQPSDELLMDSYVQGEASGFDTLYSRYAARLFSFLRVRLGTRRGYLAEELFQKIWLKIHLSRQSFDSSQRFSAWFYTVALNTLRDELRSAYEKFEGALETPENLADTSGTTSEDQCIRKEQVRKIHSFLLTLPENQRTALLLSDEEELSSKEISQIMNLTDASVRQLISRARKSVRTHFEQLFEEDLRK